MRSRSSLLQLLPLLASLAAAAFAAGPPLPAPRVTASGYLRAPGFNVMLYNSTYSPVFFDQKNAAMQIILYDRRIATNGSVRLLSTPEQWDPIPLLRRRRAEPRRGRLVAELAYPAYRLRYRVVVSAEPGGVRVSVNLAQPLPRRLVGQAGFNLEFLPSIYMDKDYIVDHRRFGVFPRSPEERMTQVPGRHLKGEMYYTADLHRAEGYTQPLPFAAGHTITLAPEAPLDRITITSARGPLLLYDGRNLAQNGWFVLRTLIPAGKTRGAVVWHIRPNYIPRWTRPPSIAHSQAGYAPDFPKIAVLELDPRFQAPGAAQVLRLMEDGSYRQVFTGPISPLRRWLRYDYAQFDFSPVRRPGFYVIEYAGVRSGVFPIASDVYDHTWQTTLDGFLAVQMDHVSVRDAYRLWHGLAYMDDARQAPPDLIHFDGYWMGKHTYSPYRPGQHIPGLNTGGWFDAGDFDNDAFSQYLTIQNLALAYETFHHKWDELTVDERARKVEMHRPDGVPDLVEQVEHGILQTLAQIHAVGHTFMGLQSATLRGYTFIGDGASQTDGRIYDPKLGPNQVRGNFSGRPDDRWAWTNYNSAMEYAAAAALASASRVLRGWNDPLAKQCLQAAIRLWNEQKAHPVASRFQAIGRFGAPDWSAALELMIATRGAEPYKRRVETLFPVMLQRLGFGGWTAVRALPYLGPAYRARLRAAVQAWLPQLNRRLAATPFGVPPTMGDWGGSGMVAEFGVQMYFLHQAFPDLVGPQYTLRAANYLLGTHPVDSISYISGIGKVSKLKSYGSNRADNTFVPGGMIPGYIVIKPDFPECIANFGFLWFEDENTISAASSWIVEANAAEALVRQSSARRPSRPGGRR